MRAHLGLHREQRRGALVDGLGVVDREALLRAGDRDAAAAAALLSRAHREQRGAECRDAILHRLLRARAERHDRDHRADADHDAEHREQRTELVCAQRAEGDADDFSNEHLISLRGRRRAAAAAATRPAARSLLSAERARVLTNAILLLETLRLHGERSEHHDSLAFLETARDFGVVEVALAELHERGWKTVFVLSETNTSPARVRCGRPPISGDGVSEPPRPPRAELTRSPAARPLPGQRHRSHDAAGAGSSRVELSVV